MLAATHSRNLVHMPYISRLFHFPAYDVIHCKFSAEYRVLFYFSIAVV